MQPSELARAEFATVRKGYAPDEVRALLGQVARDLDDLQGRLADAQSAARAAEAEAADVRGRSDEIRADALDQARVVREQAGRDAAEALASARREAESTLTKARQRAEATEREASERASALVVAAEQQAAARAVAAEEEARAAAEAEKARHQDAIGALSAKRAALEGEVAALDDDASRLRALLEVQRSRLATAAAGLQRVVDDPSGLGALAARDPELASALAEAAEPDVGAELAGLGALPTPAPAPVAEPPFAPPVERVVVGLPAPDDAPRLDDELVERFFAEGTYVDPRFFDHRTTGGIPDEAVGGDR